MVEKKKTDIQRITLQFPKDKKPPQKLGRERNRVLKDLTKRSVFKILQDSNGPYCIELSSRGNKLVFQIKNAKHKKLPLLILSLSPYKRIIKDYFMMIDSYEALKGEATASKLETIDMARRALHNEAAEMMIERLSDKIMMNLDTARGFFTLICVLHLSCVQSEWV